MRMRLLLGGLVSAAALSVVPQPASATTITCDPAVEVACVVLRTLCANKFVPCD